MLGSGAPIPLSREKTIASVKVGKESIQPSSRPSSERDWGKMRSTRQRLWGKCPMDEWGAHGFGLDWLGVGTNLYILYILLLLSPNFFPSNSKWEFDKKKLTMRRIVFERFLNSIDNFQPPWGTFLFRWSYYLAIFCRKTHRFIFRGSHLFGSQPLRKQGILSCFTRNPRDVIRFNMTKRNIFHCLSFIFYRGKIRSLFVCSKSCSSQIPYAGNFL